MNAAVLLSLVVALLLAPFAVRAQGIGYQVVAGSAIAQSAQQVARRFAHDGQKILPTGPIADERVVPGRLTIEAGSPQTTPSFVAVPVKLLVDGNLVRTVLVGYYMLSYVDATVVTGDLPAGHVITADDLRTGRVPANVRSRRESAVLVGRKLMTPLRGGAPIVFEDTAVDQIVHAGDVAILRVRDGPISLTTDVIARSSAGLGETVAVFNPRTNKVLSGVVTARGQVDITLDGEVDAR